MEKDAVVAEAEGYAELGLHYEAWDFIEDLPPSMRTTFPIMRVRLRCALAMEAWDMTETLAVMLGTGNEQDAAYSAGVLQQLAAIHLLRGDERRARVLLRAALQIWPAQREAILIDPALSTLF
ncbi:hypothetical protein OKA04_12840 [Luteolibacter flavescens]|uniref:Tetratricopeptide repeat protein n=1 Tax=Luteolibacter flavescens TaxID=1859460 RepID=A0ABT3FPX7_9BACT|nr:hypothetical protein [Luteolibacter flavescens]MCW1885618.1 hypothetical protein [Luteolibacter flavescens]